MMILNKYLKPILTRLIKYISFLIVLALFFSGYQEYSSRNEYTYFNLWNYKTREKVFIKGNSKVYLIGMIHIGESSYYEKIVKELDSIPKDQVITLIEGVSDNRKNKKESSFNYKDLSSIFGLTSQSLYMKKFPNIIHADIKFSDFSKETQSNLDDLDSLFKIFVSLLKKKSNIEDFNKEFDLHKEKLEQGERFLKNDNELIFKRNDKLWTHILEQEDKFSNIVVPWGARHLPDIESRLLASGYVLDSSKTYKVVNIPALIYRVLPYIKYLSSL